MAHMVPCTTLGAFLVWVVLGRNPKKDLLSRSTWAREVEGAELLQTFPSFLLITTVWAYLLVLSTEHGNILSRGYVEVIFPHSLLRTRKKKLLKKIKKYSSSILF